MLAIKAETRSHPVLPVILALAALGLWLPLLLLAALLFSGSRDYGTAMAFGLIAVFSLKVGAIAIVLLVLYAALAKPWRRPGRAATFFWLQIPAAILVCIGMAAMGPGYLDDVKREARQTRNDERFRQLIDALTMDDVGRFSQLLLSCGRDCNGPWLEDAVAYNAPRCVGFLLKDTTASGYKERQYSEPQDRSGCVNSALYNIPLSLAGFVGLHDNPAITNRFVPLWDRADLQQALHGAAAGDHVDLMKDLVARGADPHEQTRGHSNRGLIAAALRGGAVDALRWLAANHVRIRTDSDRMEAWHSLSMWISNTSLQVSAQRLDALLDAMKALGVDPAPPASATIQPLKASVVSMGPDNGILAAALIRHGAHPEYLPQDIRDALKNTISRPASIYAVDDGTLKRICERRSKGEATRDWTWPDWTIGDLP
ncbi:ankyrin repeat domain-containing protein [Trinickia sp.]|uniref:ankyrin repeat domain-containing protein n=1 Tax=Trinickia sp. TaxID=2571163 RepID=UPI003F7DA30E